MLLALSSTVFTGVSDILLFAGDDNDDDKDAGDTVVVVIGVVVELALELDAT